MVTLDGVVDDAKRALFARDPERSSQLLQEGLLPQRRDVLADPERDVARRSFRDAISANVMDDPAPRLSRPPGSGSRPTPSGPHAVLVKGELGGDHQ